MTVELRLSLTNAALIEDEAALVIQTRDGGRLTIASPPTALRAALRLLVGEGATGETLDAAAGSTRDSLHDTIERLDALSLLARQLLVDGVPLATMIAYAPPTQTPPFRPRAAYVLSRFALVRQIDSETVIESPAGRARVVLHDWRGLALLSPIPPAEFAKDVARAFRNLLYDAGLMARSDKNGAPDEPPALAAWSVPSLLFHAANRDRQFAPNANGAPRGVEPPVVKPPMSDDILPLFAPDMHALEHGDMPFTRVHEGRRSEREHGDAPITLHQLGEFLYRAARVKQVVEGDYHASERPYPSAGALYPLEIYLAVHCCEGLPRGLYHYAPLDHQLERLPATDAAIAPMRRDAEWLTGQTYAGLQVLVIITARVERVSWKYGDAALPLILKDVGVLYQTLYLVAMAMGLAPCALGAGNSRLFAAASSLDPLVEPSVGEFWIGSKKNV